MEQDNVDQIAKNRQKFENVVWHVKNGVGLSVTADPALAQAIIWASERIGELEGQTQSPETGSDEVRGLFFRLGGGCELNAVTYCEAVAWGQDRIRHLERDKRDVQGLLNQISELRRENEQLELELEHLSKTILTLSKSPQLTSPDSEEEIHQRRRRERMLDEITLICVSKDIETMSDDSGDALETGFRARDMASDIWAGINEFDLQL